MATGGFVSSTVVLSLRVPTVPPESGSFSLRPDIPDLVGVALTTIYYTG
jgi:hypothetical protein